MLEKSLEAGERGSHTMSRGTAFQAEGTASAKAPRKSKGGYLRLEERWGGSEERTTVGE